MKLEENMKDCIINIFEALNNIKELSWSKYETKNIKNQTK